MKAKRFAGSFTSLTGWILFFILVLCNGLLIWQNTELKQKISELSARQRIQTGDDFIDFTAADEENHIVAIKSQPDIKKVVLFFSTTCPYCKKQNLYWIDFLKTVDAASYEVLAVFNRKEDIKKVSEYIETNGYREIKVSMKVLFIDDDTSEKYKLNSTPTTLVLNERGQVEKVWLGLWSAKMIADVNAFFHISLSDYS